jgi:predicted Fe-Mo cluster-binding NifX family protein
MKIAIASDDRINLALHFGRTRGFLVYELDGGQILGSEYVENTFTGHSSNHKFENHGHHHSHGRILEALHDCDAIISHGMGRRMMDDFERAGKQVFIASAASAEDAVKQYLSGSLKHDPSRSCQHSKGAL